MQKRRAVTLPEGSVVADDRTVYIARVDPKGGDFPRWEGNLGIEATDAGVDAAIASGAQVLRVGIGKEG